MIRKLFFYSLLLFCLQAHGQSNTSVRASLCVPTGTHTENIALSSTPHCTGGSVKLYYQFYAASYQSLATIGTWSLGTGTFSYKVYGPFASMEEGMIQVEAGVAVAKTASTSPASSAAIPVGALVPAEAYLIEVTLSTCTATLTVTGVSVNVSACSSTRFACDDCLGTFFPSQGKYVLSAWVKEENAAVTKTSYTFPFVQLTMTSTAPSVIYTFTPSGEIIDGWQQITGVFDVIPGMTSIRLTFDVNDESALFDDIRVFPFDGSMMGYVYDPVTLRLVAELDERNYAKLYEYDEEGKLVRVKKETEKGIMTITDTRENSVKKP